MRYFVAVAEELHFGRAAERLHLAQQPLSAAIKRLEDSLGVRLFERTSRKVELTEAGQVYLKEVRSILQHTADAAEAAQRTARGEVGQLSVGYASGTLHNVLPPTVRRFRERYPDVELKLHELSSPEVEAALNEGNVRVGLLCPPVSNPALSMEIVLREPLIIALPKGHALTKLTRVPLRAAADEHFVLYQRAIKPSVYDAITGLCRSAGFSPRVTQEVATEGAVVGLVAAGMGLALVSSSQRKAPSDGIEYRFLEGPSVEVELAAAWARMDCAPITTAFLGMVRAAGKELTAAEHHLSRAL